MEEVRQDLETNFYGPLLVTRAFAPIIESNGGGHILNVHSALWSQTNSLRLQLRPRGIAVTGLHLAYVDTDMTLGLDAPKADPRDVAVAALDGIEAGAHEVLADDTTQLRDPGPVWIYRSRDRTVEAIWQSGRIASSCDDVSRQQHHNSLSERVRMRSTWRLLLGLAVLAAGSLTLAPAASAQSRSDVSILVSCQQIYYGATGKTGLEAGGCLAPGASLEVTWHWNSGRYQRQVLQYQSDGNFVLYRFVSGQSYGTAIWATNTNGRAAGQAAMQTDGNFVLYDNRGQAYWSTNTWNCAGDWNYKQLDMQIDENIVIYFWPRSGSEKVAKWDRWGISRC